MKRLNTIIFLCAICTSIFAQGINDLDKQTKKYLETAEKYIEDFHCDSVIKAYPIFNVFRKKEYRNKTFDKIPTLAELEQFLDFKHPVIDHVLVKTTDNKVIRIWTIMPT